MRSIEQGFSVAHGVRFAVAQCHPRGFEKPMGRLNTHISSVEIFPSLAETN